MDDAILPGSFGGDSSKITDKTKLECKICWYVYQPEIGDDYWQIASGTPFSQLPEDWTCPECDGNKNDFMVIDR